MANVISPVQYQLECADFEWRVRSIVLEERLSQPWYGELRALTNGVVTPDDLIGIATRVTIDRDGATRTFRGEITRAETGMTKSGETHARLRFEPLVARGRRGVRHRIFQRISVVDIVREVLGPIGECDFEVVLDRDRDVREYCVQYGESDLDFALRLLEDEGIAWFLDCAPERPVMHLVEGKRGYPAIAADEIELRLLASHFEEVDVETIQRLSPVRRPASLAAMERTWKWVVDPHVCEQVHPEGVGGAWTEHVEMRRMATSSEIMTDREVREFTKGHAQIEHERAACRDLLVRGDSNVSALAAGSWFTFDLGDAEPTPLLVVGVVHRGDCPEVELGAGHGGQNYTNTFECQLLDVPHRPQRTIARPRIHGMHTAVVTGPKDEEIHVDAFGCICVRMHWDRADTAPELASCWLRVAQMFAGPGWGSVFIPRVGTEVLVAFLDGDPDRPMCVGSLYNGGHEHPYPLPDDRTKTTIRTQSSPGGNGYNELTFEDAAGAEEVYLRAQRNLRTQVLSNESRSVGADQTIGIGRDQNVTIDGNQSVSVKGDQMIFVSGTKDGLFASNIQIGGRTNVQCQDLYVTADECIVLRVGGSSITIDGESITFVAGAGTMQKLDETAVILAGRGSMMRLASTVAMSAVGGATLQMDGEQTVIAAALGSSVVLTNSATLGAGLGAKLELGTDATLDAASIIATATMGGKLTLDTDAAVEGAQVSCASAGGSMTLSPSGAAIDGTTVDVTAAAMATVVSAMVKIN